MREWRNVVDKEDWPRGEWDAEPDKVQWVDEATNLDCPIVRGPSGALCGYVGVPDSHPYFEVGYSGCTKKPPCGESYCGHSPDVDVHGGLTFADHCHEASREAWESWRVRLRGREAEAAKYPQGDSARALKREAQYLDNYEAWAEYRQGRGICRIPEEGRTDNVWWFGFDCAHSGDLSDMAYRNTMRDREQSYEDSYRTVDYVKREVGRLAQQLAAVA